MCGLVAIVRTDGQGVDTLMLAAMMDAVRHRGPDDSGTHVLGTIGIGFRRLSILDLSLAGHQPMTSTDGDCVIAFNGEIYNFIEIRDELAGLGYRFRSSGDTEVLLNAYRAWGPACLNRLNGMWSFVIHDLRRKVLFGARDRFGIKPLYHCQAEGTHLFASEIKSIRASGQYRVEPNWRVASSFLLEQRLDETRETFFAGIEHIPAGSAFELSLSGDFRLWSYWTLAMDWRESARNPADVFAELFEDAIRLSMRSDVPVGVHLSGGLDSTSIICASARVRRRESASGDLIAFSYIAPEFDETRFIDETVAETGAHLNRLATSPHSLWSKLERVLAFQDEPVHSLTAIVGYELMHLTALRGIKVILNGQGADETIGGYPSYFPAYWQSLLERHRFAAAWQEMRRSAEQVGGTAGRLFLSQLKHWLQFSLRDCAPYRILALQRRRARLHKIDWYTRDLTRHLSDAPAVEGNDLAHALADSIKRSPLPLYLRVEDRNSMAHSIEARVPFLDYRLVNFVFSLSPEWHMRGPFNKYVLRESMRGRIPETVRTRIDKMGFPTPSKKWLSDALHGQLCSVLLDRTTHERGVFNLPAIERDLKRQAAGAGDLSTELFNAAQFELWSRISQTSGAVDGSGATAS